MKSLDIKAAQAGKRLDLVVSGWLKITRSQAARAIRAREVLLNDFGVKPGEVTKLGDKISYVSSSNPTHNLKLPIIYEDDDMLVVDKPAGLIVHPTGSTKDQATLVDFIRNKTSDTTADRPGIVHRLDRDTSGLVIVAKTAAAKDYLQRLFASRKVEKEYLALVEGQLERIQAEITLPIGAGRGVRRQIDPAGRRASTSYEVINQLHDVSFVRAYPHTGRTHQLRVHFAAIGHPIVGDILYGKGEPSLKRHFLHAHKLSFRAPSGKWLELTSPLPKELKSYLDRQQ